MGPTRQGARPGGGRALDPRGQVVAPPDVFSVPDILKYLEKNSVKISGHSNHFYVWALSISWKIQKTAKTWHFIVFN